MADTKISLLNSATTAAGTDVFPLVQALETKKITFNALFGSPPAIGGTTPAAGSFTTLNASGRVGIGTGTYSNPSAGGGQINGSASSGLAIAGNGSTYDLVIANKVGTSVLRIPTGTNAVEITGAVTLGDATNDTVTANGYMGVGGAASSNVGLNVVNTALATLNQYGISANPTGTSSATTSITGLYAAAKTAASAFTCASVYNAYIDNSTKGSGSTITSQYGVYVADQTQGTNNYGFYSAVSSGTNKWAFYGAGTATSYFGGNVGIGTTAPSVPLMVANSGGSTSIIAARPTSTVASGCIIGFQLYNASNAYVSYGSITSVITTNTAGSHAGDLVFNTATAGGLNERMRIDSSGNVLVNTAAIATTATDGFLYVPSCAGTPTGTPTTYTGRVPIVVDTTNNKLYFYSGGAWRDAGP